MTLAMFVLLGAIGVVGAYAFIPDMEGDVRMLTACLIVTGIASESNDTTNFNSIVYFRHTFGPIAHNYVSQHSRKMQNQHDL